MIYGVIGSGAVGAYYGSKLVKAGNDVHFLFHNDYQYVKENGLTIKSCDGDFSLPKINAYYKTSDMPICDVVIVALKTVNQDVLRNILSPLVVNGTLVLLIQNGIGVEEDLQKIFPNLEIAAGLAFICSAKINPGIVNHQCYGSINIGNFSCKDESKVDNLISDFNAAGISAAKVEYYEARWKKAVWNMPFNGMSVALNANTHQLLSHSATENLIRLQMLEVVGAAQKLGVKNVDELFVEKMLQMTREMTPYFPSMKLDFDFKRKMEIYYIYTRPIEIARKVGFEMPRLQMLESILKFQQAKYLYNN